VRGAQAARSAFRDGEEIGSELRAQELLQEGEDERRSAQGENGEERQVGDRYAPKPTRGLGQPTLRRRSRPLLSGVAAAVAIRDDGSRGAQP
jgi:hypothetical protein